jgi:hypothetical protein
MRGPTFAFGYPRVFKNRVRSYAKKARAVSVTAILALVVTALSPVYEAVSATPHSTPKSCGYQSGPACPLSAPTIGPWLYQATNPQLLGNPDFYSVAEVEAAWTNYLVTQAKACSVSFGTPADQSPSSDGYSYGVLTSIPYMAMPDTVVTASNGTPPCSYPGERKRMVRSETGSVLPDRLHSHLH